MTRKVWFQLVDGETRDAYTDTQTVSVSSDLVSDIDDLHEGVGAAQLRIYANRAVYDDKNGQPLEECSPIGSIGAAKKDALIVVVKVPTVLSLRAQASYPLFLEKAIEIANVMLMHYNEFELELGADKTTSKNLRDVKVEFRRPEKPSLYSWTERSASAKVIFVNEVLRDRMEINGQAENPHEYQCIVFVVAAKIFHECAHLTLRWRNILDSPSKFGAEVGNYMEAKPFQGICRVKIQQSTRAVSKKSKRSSHKWTKEMPILDVVIEFDGLSVVRADHLSKFFTKGKLRDKALFPLDREAYQKTEGAITFGADRLSLDGDHKRCRTLPGDPNVIIPPLCGISKNRYAQRDRPPNDECSVLTLNLEGSTLIM